MAGRGVYWRCFHCGAAFTKAQVSCARQHFGACEDATPACQMRTPGEYHLLNRLRRLELELESYRAEDTDLHRALHAMEDEHRRALVDAEQEGYDKGLTDARLGQVLEQMGAAGEEGGSN